MASRKEAAVEGRRSAPDVYDEVAYVYDGTLEGMLSAIFAAYANHEDPSDVVARGVLQPRLSQRVYVVETDLSHAERVRRGLCRSCGCASFDAVKKASLSSDVGAATFAYRFVRYAMDMHKVRDCVRCRKRETCAGAARPATGAARPAAGARRPVAGGYCPKLRGRALSDITHPAVEPLFRVARAVDQECEHMRQFIRFEHLTGDGTEVWFARCNPRDSVVPLIMGHFVERFNVQPFIIYDENHDVAGVYDGDTWFLVRTDDPATSLLDVPARSSEEEDMQRAWRRFYCTVAVEARYNPELRRHFMPKRFWRNLTEMQEDLPESGASSARQPSASRMKLRDAT